VSPWLDPDTGEVGGECPLCGDVRAETEAQMRAMEMDLRRWRAKCSKLENAAERELVAKRDGAAWKEFLRCYKAAFPEKRLSATGVKSATATDFFLRLQAGTDLEGVKNAIAGAVVYPYIVYGRRVKSGSRSDLANHPRDILSVNNDANFDFLVEVGAEVRGLRDVGARLRALTVDEKRENGEGR